MTENPSVRKAFALFVKVSVPSFENFADRGIDAELDRDPVRSRTVCDSGVFAAGILHGKAVPKVNASLPAGHWQNFQAVFHNAEVKDGKVVKKPRITVYHNGTKVVDDAEIDQVRPDL